MHSNYPGASYKKSYMNVQDFNDIFAKKSKTNWGSQNASVIGIEATDSGSSHCPQIDKT